MKVGLIDYGVGNLGSVFRALEELRVTPVLVQQPAELSTVDRLILPGVGSFTDCMALLNENGWRESLVEQVSGNERPLLGICVGMQLLASSGMEGADSTSGTAGLGLVPGTVQHLGSLGCEFRLPHVGWNAIVSTVPGSTLLWGIPDNTDFYFVHSYAFCAENPEHILATTPYGVDVTAVVQHGHVCGTQFHPEKSSRAGFRLLENFVSGSIC